MLIKCIKITFHKYIKSIKIIKKVYLLGKLQAKTKSEIYQALDLIIKLF